jgi:Chaperone of endosialidase
MERRTKEEVPMVTKMVVLLAAGLAPVAMAAAGDATLAADTYISAAYPTTNFGLAPSLIVRNGNMILVRFDLSSTLGGATAADVSHATLRLFVNYVGVPGALEIAPVTSPWNELQVTWLQIPPVGSPVATIPVTQGMAFVTADITSLVRGWATDPTTNYGVALQASIPNTVVAMDSKESQATSHAPELDIALAPVTGSAVMVRIGGNTNGNTAAGADSLQDMNSGGPSAGNTAFGAAVLRGNTTGYSNTGVGSGALSHNTEGMENTAIGSQALGENQAAGGNTAIGVGALRYDTVGALNTAIGSNALFHNAYADYSTAVGSYALFSNSDLGQNDALGSYALYSNTTGMGNVAAGRRAMEMTNGNWNVAVGQEAMRWRTQGAWSTAVGSQALAYAAGDYNIAIGAEAGSSLKAGSNNIDIGNGGVETDSNTIRIGTQDTHKSAYIAGISGAAVAGGVSVLINSDGQLGTTVSSRVYKKDIRDLGDISAGLMRLRPVSFRYKQAAPDGAYPIEYGLIAEEVAQVCPELVTRSADGQVQSVRYQLLSAMLLNELQKQHAKIQSLEQDIAGMKKILQALTHDQTQLASAR